MIQSAFETPAASLPHKDANFVRHEFSWFLEGSSDPTVLLTPWMTFEAPDTHEVLLTSVHPQTGVYSMVCRRPNSTPDQKDYYYFMARAGSVVVQREYLLSNGATMDEWATPNEGDLQVVTELFDQLRAHKQVFDHWERSFERPAKPPTSFMDMYLGNLALCATYWGSATRAWFAEVTNFNQKTAQFSAQLLAMRR